MPDASPSPPLELVVVGGGVAALETVLALHDLAGDRIQVTLIAPEPDLVLRPLAIAASFSRAHVDQLPLEQILDEHGGRFVRSAVERVDTRAHTLTLVTGAEVPYDVLVLAQGASEVPVVDHAITFGADPSAYGGLLADLEEGYTTSVGFVVPEGCTWPLPIYELALLTADEAWSMNMDRVELHLLTPEAAPLDLFGAAASTVASELLDAARITVHLGAQARVPRSGVIDTGTGRELVVDRIVALPVLEGRRLAGIPADAQGFVPVDDAGLASELDDVYAVGDASNRPIKQGGLACQQADVTAAHIAARAGAEVEVPPLTQELQGRLLTGGRDRFMARRPASDTAPTTSAEPLWWPPEKVCATYLSPYLATKDLIHIAAHGAGPTQGVDVHVQLANQTTAPDPGALSTDGLRPITPRRVASRA